MMVTLHACDDLNDSIPTKPIDSMLAKYLNFLCIKSIFQTIVSMVYTYTCSHQKVHHWYHNCVCSHGKHRVLLAVALANLLIQLSNPTVDHQLIKLLQRNTSYSILLLKSTSPFILYKITKIFYILLYNSRKFWTA